MISKVKNHLGATIVHTGRLLTNSINSHFLALGTNITFEQLDVLLLIASNPGKRIIQNDLAILVQKNKSGILRTIDILEKKHFVRRSPVAGDRRKNMIEATEEGIKIAKGGIELFLKIEREFIKKISKSDVLACTKVLDVIKKNAGLTKAGAQQRPETEINQKKYEESIRTKKITV
jgi:DNA-binding MarR family transcriptional regulator